MNGQLHTSTTSSSGGSPVHSEHETGPTQSQSGRGDKGINKTPLGSQIWVITPAELSRLVI